MVWLAAPALALLVTPLGALRVEPPQGAAPAELDALPLPHAAELELGTWRAHLLPGPGEVERIPWVPSFAEGVLRSARERRPLLFWAMNGHPLACT